MSRRLVVGVVALAAGIALLAAALLLPDRRALPAVDRLAAAAELSTSSPRFGDEVRAVVEVLLDRRAVDPGSVRVDASFSPFHVGATHRDRVDAGLRTRLRYEYVLDCLRSACVPGPSGDGTGDPDAGFLLPPASVRYTLVDGRPRETPVGWPEVRIGSQLRQLDFAVLPWRAQIRPLPPMRYRLAPRVLAAGTALAALLALAGGGLLLLARLRPETARALAVRRRRGSVLERALAAVRNAAAGEDAEERRRALDLLARELRDAKRGRSHDARRLAWSRERPGRSEMERLADAVEGADT